MNKQEVFNWIAEQFGAEPEFPWMQYPDYATFKKPNGKWFAVAMTVPESKLGLKSDRPMDILNVKCDPIMIGSLRLENGFYPAYHMSKTNWISIALDGTVDEGRIKELIALSFDLAGKKNR